MLTISTIPEALAELAKQTGRAWTDSELLDLAANLGIELHAAPPITAQTTIQKFVIGEGLVEKFRSGPGHARLAVLFPWQVGQLWLSGETLARHTERHDEIEGEYQWFTEPVRVTREQVRIKAATLEKILTIWRKEQPAPATDTATSEPVAEKVDLTLMASREQLIAAFGVFTGMKAEWFKNIKDTPALLAARKVTGQGGRGHIVAPMFCPYEVLQWLIDPARRKGRKLGADKGWELFEGHFPRSYAAFSIGDPRTD